LNKDVLMVKIHATLAEGLDFYEATRKYWRVSKKRLNHLRYVIGINDQKVVCAFTPTEWQIATKEIAPNPNDIGRKIFIGHEVPIDTLELFQKSEDFLLTKFGNRQSIAYAFINDIKQFASKYSH